MIGVEIGIQIMKKVLILSGPTHEYFDPVRFIGNASSGKMGKALAEEAIGRGMDVEFITGPVPDRNLPVNPALASHYIDDCFLPKERRLNIRKVVSAEEMLSAAKETFAAADLIVFAAAVADYQPEETLSKKLPKTGGNISLELKPTPDIAATLCAKKRGDQIAVGFALQTHDGETKAKEKLSKKNLDGIILNTPATLGAENGLFTWIHPTGTEEWGSLEKSKCAQKIFNQMQEVE